ASQIILQDPVLKSQAADLVKVIHFFASKNWCPATATNFSVRCGNRDGEIIISRSGVNKHEFSLEHLMLVNLRGTAVDPRDAKSSAETLIHTTLYELKGVNAVLHTHSVAGTILSLMYGRGKSIHYAGYELLKGLEGNKTHDMRENVPIIPNTQDMVQ